MNVYEKIYEGDEEEHIDTDQVLDPTNAFSDYIALDNPEEEDKEKANPDSLIAKLRRLNLEEKELETKAALKVKKQSYASRVLFKKG